jgi:broad specificity phosphatase PhoE
MSTLLMVRHGQASFGEVDYDRLSEMGVTQSALLGEYWLKRGQRFDALFTGAQKRQVDTLQALRDVYSKAGCEVPEAVVNDAFNEYDASGMLANFLPILLSERPELEETVARAMNVEENSQVRRKAFQEILTIVMNRWIAGEVDEKSVESWERFTQRVVRGVEEIVASFPTGKTVAVFTSGGPISAVMQYALETTDRIALSLGWAVKNASINEFKYQGDRFSLTGFNMTPHFDEDTYVTFR